MESSDFTGNSIFQRYNSSIPFNFYIMRGMERPIVVNSVLCFIHNFRKLANLRPLVQRSFSSDLVEEARSVLLRRTSPLEAVHLPQDIVDLYDVFNARENLIFAATDLSQLPLTLTPSNDCLEVLKEIQSLRSYISETLEGKPDDGQHRDSITPTARCKLNTSASSPEFPTPVSQGPSPTGEEESPKASTPSDDAPLSINLSQNSAKRKGTRSLDDTVKKLCAKFKPDGDEQPSVAIPAGWTSQVDPQTYLNMLRMMQSPTNPGTLFGSMFGQIQRLSNHAFMQHQDSLDEKDEGLEDGESSPSPSEEIKDEFPMLEMSVDNDSDKPFICEHSNCQKRFANKFLLKKHQFIHTGLRPHTCPFCNKRFNRKDNLLRHKKTHMQNGGGDTDAGIRRSVLPEAICGLISTLTPPMIPEFKIEVEEQIGTA